MGSSTLRLRLASLGVVVFGLASLVACDASPEPSATPGRTRPPPSQSNLDPCKAASPLDLAQRIRLSLSVPACLVFEPGAVPTVLTAEPMNLAALTPAPPSRYPRRRVSRLTSLRMTPGAVETTSTASCGSRAPVLRPASSWPTYGAARTSFRALRSSTHLEAPSQRPRMARRVFAGKRRRSLTRSESRYGTHRSPWRMRSRWMPAARASCYRTTLRRGSSSRASGAVSARTSLPAYSRSTPALRKRRWPTHQSRPSVH